ncbi:MAG: tRNA pseudouridine(38-40) synthase TruA [Candidatus Omnitrophica bacterium]|nr:tRNA pseudouridine(38-40) synthase TruA [Candidatus Omnitrophota bacterium]MCM8827055.1 tRNA pseudouridine(38-40) synthase TruA [Candidatus Omnitrophota bacterium]
MFQNIFLEIEYDGSNYFGWQIQNYKLEEESNPSPIKTIQGELEYALKRLFNREIKITYASRTDRGVHALQQCVNFKVDTDIPLNNIRLALNSFLSENIRIKKIKTVPLDFHSRFSVKSKIYRYIIYNAQEPSVFHRNYSWFLPQSIDIERINDNLYKLIGKKNFSCFAKGANNYKSCVRDIKNITVKKRGKFIYIDIEADGFLRNMARNIVAFLVNIGIGKISSKDILRIINRKITWVNKPAPSCGLYLYKVKY